MPAPRTTTEPGERPLVIAVAGIRPRTGVTTTTVALAQAWPGPDPAVIVEADPVGGQLAGLTGADAYLGLASLARATHLDADAAVLGEHLQLLPGGVALLAAPPEPDTAVAALTTSLLTGDRTTWRHLGATVFADCGAPQDDSALTPILTAADACLVVLRATDDPVRAGHRIRQLTAASRHRGILVLGTGPREFTAALGLPVLGYLPHERHSATALLRGTRPPHRRNHLLPAARALTVALADQLRATPPASVTSDTGSEHTRTRLRARGSRHRIAHPTVYRLDSAITGVPPSRTPPASAAVPVPPPAPAPVPPAVLLPVPPPVRPRPGPPPDTAPPAAVSADTGPGLAIRVFGPTRILWRTGTAGGAGAAGVEITGRLQPRSRELLAVLALHPEGLSRPALTEALWGEHPPYRPGNALANALYRLRTAVTAATGGDGLLSEDRMRARLDPAAVTVDYWEFNTAVAARRRRGSDEEQATACRRIIDLATGPLATDLTHDWAEPLREAARRNALNALGWLAAHTVGDDPRATLGMLETAIESDPYNQMLWHDILRLHARLGEYDALARTSALLTRKLAEIGATPSPETLTLIEHLSHPAR